MPDLTTRSVALALAAGSLLVSYLAMVIDKRRARLGLRRVPERTLLLLGLPAGGSGTWLAMLLIRHKSRKLTFQLQLAMVTLIAAGLWLLLLRSDP